MYKNWKIETKTVQSGYEPKNSEPRVLPLFQSTTYKYETAEEVAKLFDLEKDGHMYTRISNPTIECFEKKIADLEGGVGALAVSSGQTATTIAIMNICTNGENFIAASTLYGGSVSLMTNTLNKSGIEVRFVDPEASINEISKKIDSKTKLIFAETIGNPGLNVLDFEKFSQISKTNGIPFVVDNTFATPYLCNPFKFGVDIVTHSTSKYIDGHASCIGGIIVDSGNFNWNNGKFSEFTEPDISYHGIRYFEKFGKSAYIVKARVQLLRDYGCCMSPFNAFLTNFGCETLHLRMKEHSANALKLAEFLQNHKKVSWVNYPGLKESKYYDLAKKYLPKGCSGVLTFGVKGGVESGKKFINNLKLAALVVHVADVRTCVLHPASTTHRQLSEQDQIAAGVSPDLIRVSVGIENISDIIEDFENSFGML